MRYLLGVDFGGSSSKATLLGEDGKVYAVAGKEYPTFYPENGWAEQDPDDSYRALVDNIHQVVESAGIQPDEITALALDAATHTMVLLDSQDRPVRRAIYWTDTRSAPQAAKLKAELGNEIIAECFNSVSSLWTLPQLVWLKENEPETIRKTQKIMAMKDYIRYRLTGDYVTDSIEAMGNLLLDARSNRWSEKLCGIAGIDIDKMPVIVDPLQRMSRLTIQAMADTGLSKDTIVIAGATDTVMEVYAAGAITPGQATVKLATAGRICPITDHAVVDPRLVTYRHVINGLWYPGTATKSCASANRWYRDTFGGNFAEMSEGAARIARGCEGLYFHPYLQGEITPYLNDRLRASFTGAAGFHTREHFNRAVLEGVAYSMKDCFSTLIDLGIAPTEAIAIGGGAKSDLWRGILADMLNIPLTTVENVDSSLGSAMLAGVATGIFTNHQEAVDRCRHVSGITMPNPEGVSYYQEHFGIYKRIQQALEPIYNDMK